MKKQTIVVTIVLVALLVGLLGGWGVASCVEAKNAVVTFGGRNIPRDVYAYWQVRFAYAYRTAYGEGAANTEDFWQSVPDPQSGKTHREACDEYTQKMVTQILIAATLFDREGYTLTATQRENLTSVWETATGGYRFGGDEDGYERLAADYGFTKDSVKTALVYEMKANLLAAIAEADEAQLLAYYAEQYVRVKILYVNTAVYYYVDEAGNRVQDENGNDRYRPLTAKEKAEKEAKYLAVLSKLDAFGGMTAEQKRTAFDSLMATYNEDGGAKTYPDGYFFAPNAAFTVEYAQALPVPVESALSLSEEDTYTVCEDGWGTYIIYRYPPSAAALAETYNQPFFSDLTADANRYYLLAWIGEYTDGVVWQDPPTLPTATGNGEEYKLIVSPPPAV